MRFISSTFLTLFLTLPLFAQFTLDGELKKWHKVTLTFDGPSTSETAATNPFTDYRLNVTFTNGSTSYTVPGYYAAETSASGGNKWRVHFAPDKTGTWNWTASFRTGNQVAMDDSDSAGSPAAFDGLSGSFNVGPTDKTGRDHRAKGRLQYVGQRYLRFAETGEYFLKIGADAPENFLAYDDFDNTPNNGGRRKSWDPHEQDWTNGDPSWQSGKGKGIIGALNYLAGQGQNVFSFLTMNIQGDDKNVFPYISDDAQDRLRMDCSKLDQWEIVFEHADKMGLYLHFKTQETENDQLLDGGSLGPERKLYYRELIARFAHHLALNWNIGEENTNTDQQRIDFADYFAGNDPYNHHIVIHTYPNQDDDVYPALLGNGTAYTGASLQVKWSGVHKRTLEWIANAENAGKAWVAANDEQGSASTGVPHDAFIGTPSQDDIRNAVLWGNLLAGGGGVEYYFGYQLPHSDLTCEDYRSRSNMWIYNRHAHEFMTQHVEFWNMDNHNSLIGNNNDSNDKFCLAEPGKAYVIYRSGGEDITLDLEDFDGTFKVRWFDPRNGGGLVNGTLNTISGPGQKDIGNPPNALDQDWVAWVTLNPDDCPPAGIACDDGNPATENDVEDGNCNCEGTPCPPAGTACNDGDPDTQNDVEDGFCNCEGVICPPAGTACNDGDPTTENDVEDGNCNCEGVPCPPAGTACDDGDPNTTNDVEDGFCNCQGTNPNQQTDIWLEAECGDLGNQWTLVQDGAASQNEAMEAPNSTSTGTPPNGAENQIQFSFSVSEDGDYEVYVRSKITPDANSLWVRVDDGTWQQWNTINANAPNDGYHWDQVGNWNGGAADVPTSFSLQSGNHTLHIAWREPQVRVDKVFITLDGGLPSGLGSNAVNCGDACPPAGTLCDDGDPATENDIADGNCGCAGTPCPPAGTACDDGDPATENDVEDGLCNCEGIPCPPAGTACDDGDPTTGNDVEDGNCNCEGVPCPPAGTACDDGDPATENDVEDGFCNCVGDACPPAGTPCDDGDPTTENDTADGTCGCAGTPCPPAGTACDDGDPSTENDDVDIWLEAECAQVGSDWTIIQDNAASRNEALLTPPSNSKNTPSNNPEERIRFSFAVSESGNYEIYARTQISPSANSLWVRVDDGPWVIWNTINANAPDDGYHWDQVGEWNGGVNDVPLSFDLLAGTHTLDFLWRESEVRVDKVFVTLDSGLPTGLGSSAGNCGDDCPPAGTACDDGDLATENDVEDGNCNCEGVPCPPAGTPCDDGDPTTENDTADGTCGCAGTPCPPAGTACDDGDPSTENDVEDGLCNCEGTPVDPGTDVDIWLEAECAEVGNAWTLVTPPSASGEKALLAPDFISLNNPPAGAENRIRFTFSVPESGSYEVFVRSLVTADGNSLWVRMDAGQWLNWNTINKADGKDAFYWDQVGEWTGGTNDDPVSFDLQTGSHTLDIAWREVEVTVDKVFITLSQPKPPSIGEPAENCPDDCPPAGTACDDNDPATYDDEEDGDCNCIGIPCPPAGTACDDGDPNTINDVEDGFCNCEGVFAGADTDFWLEAECAEVGSKWEQKLDFQASGDYYITPPSRSTSLNSTPDDAEDLVRFEVIIAEGGNYEIYARTVTTGDNDDSFWVRANDGDWQKWNKINSGNYGPDYQWDQVGHWENGNNADPVSFDLPPGPNVIEFSWREPKIRFDKIFLTKSEPQPTDMGPESLNCGTTTSVAPVASEAFELRLYPQPARDILRVELWRAEVQENEVVRIWDNLGRPLFSIPLPSQAEALLEVPVDHLPPGLYVLQWKNYSRAFLISR